MKFSLLLISLTTTLMSLSQLNLGDILFVGWYGDNLDGFAFVTMTTIPDGTEIYFTDNEWNGSAIGSGGGWDGTTEGFMHWTNNLGGDIPAGVVITFEGIDVPASQTTSCGQLSLVSGGNGTIRVNASNEVIYAYQGTSATNVTNFVSAIANDGFGNGTITNTGLTAGVDAFNFGSIDADADVAVYVPGDYSAASIMNTSNWSVQDGSGDQGQDGIGPDFPDDVPGGTEPCGIISTLPVELIDFSVINQNGYAQLNWMTASEINNDYFEVYRSADGLNLELIGKVEGSGNSTVQKEYRLYDYMPLEGTSYYRLKQVDFDGKFEWSDYISFQNDEEVDLEFTVYPNPVLGNSIQVKLNQNASKIMVELVDSRGALVPFLSRLQGNQITIEANLSNGIYFLHLLSEDESKVIKLVK